MEENFKINDEDLKELYTMVTTMKMNELFQEPYDPPEYLDELDN